MPGHNQPSLFVSQKEIVDNFLNAPLPKQNCLRMPLTDRNCNSFCQRDDITLYSSVIDFCVESCSNSKATDACSELNLIHNENTADQCIYDSYA